MTLRARLLASAVALIVLMAPIRAQASAPPARTQILYNYAVNGTEHTSAVHSFPAGFTAHATFSCPARDSAWALFYNKNTKTTKTWWSPGIVNATDAPWTYRTTQYSAAAQRLQIVFDADLCKIHVWVTTTTG